MNLFARLRGKDADSSAPAEARSCSHDAAIALVLAEIRALAVRIDGMQRAVDALDQYRAALHAKTWTAYCSRHVGRVAGGSARAATARRDDRGRFLPG